MEAGTTAADATRAAAAVRALLQNEKWGSKLAPYSRAEEQNVSSHLASLALGAPPPPLGADEITVIGNVLFDIEALAAGCLVSHAWRDCMAPVLRTLASRVRSSMDALSERVPQHWCEKRQVAVDKIRSIPSIDLQEPMSLRNPPWRVPRAFISGLTLAGLIGEDELARISRASDAAASKRVEWQAVKKVLVPKKSIQTRMLLEALDEVDCAKLASGSNAAGLAAVRAWRAEDAKADIHAFCIEAVRFASRFAECLLGWTLAVLDEVEHYEADDKVRRHAEELHWRRRLVSDLERRKQRHQQRLAELVQMGQKRTDIGTQLARR